MAIPASVLTYLNWLGANLAGGTAYTAAAPEKPVGFGLTFDSDNTIVASASPWPAGQYLVDMDNHSTCKITSSITSSHMAVTAGRVLFECAPTSATSVNLLNMNAAAYANGRLKIAINSGGSLLVTAKWNGGNDGEVNLGAQSANPYAVEVIYDTNNATRSQRLRARVWDIGGSPGAFSDNSDIFSSAGTTDQFVYLNWLNEDNAVTGFKAGRLAICNDIAEDLSAISETTGENTGVGSSAGSSTVLGVRSTVSTDITWETVVGNQGFRVEWGTASGGPYTNSADVATDVLTYLITDLIANTQYYVIVSALVGGVVQSPSTEIPIMVGTAGAADTAGEAGAGAIAGFTGSSSGGATAEGETLPFSDFSASGGATAGAVAGSIGSSAGANVIADGVSSSAFSPPAMGVAEGSSTVGGVSQQKKKHKRRHFLDINGTLFEVANEAHAVALLFQLQKSLEDDDEAEDEDKKLVERLLKSLKRGK